MNKLIFLFTLLSLSAGAQQIQWPHHKKAVIVLTYDDALASQLKIAAPQLKKANLKATFFLTSDMDSQTIPQWRKLAKKGFELGNHTVFHACPGNFDNPVSSDHYTQYQMIREIEVMNRFLFAVDGQNSRTYAYPCAETTIGGKDYVDTLRYYKMVKYARTGGDFNSVITDFDNLDPLRVPSLGLDDGTTTKQLIGFVKKVEQSGGMGVIMIHGVGGDYITTSAEVHQALVTYLNKNKKTIWVPTFQQAMDYVSSKIKVVSPSVIAGIASKK
jgi:peptidoglycan/xylan/chitin deacetylase (PgdA/CDA1 family)